MKKYTPRYSILFFVLLIAVMVTQTVGASRNLQDSVIEHGKYIANIAGCTSCHTPNRPEFNDPTQLNNEQIHIIALNELEAHDTSKFLAGGRAFDLGPAGIVYTRNITPDQETGLGGWTDEQIKVAVRTGQTPSGKMLFPVMPYHNYNGMADADLDAVIAYLRSVKAVNNKVPEETVATDMLKPLPYTQGIVAPDASDKAARGEYLVKYVMGCTDCHTPLDPATGQPLMDKYLGGGQPYEGPWGIVYGGNITPDNDTGIGSWSEAEIKRAIVSGVGKDGRRLILMPWYAYTGIKPEDADAVAYYIKNVLPAVKNEVPAAALNPDFVVMAPAEQKSDGMPLTIIAIAVAVVLVALVIFFVFRKRKTA